MWGEANALRSCPSLVTGHLSSGILNPQVRQPAQIVLPFFLPLASELVEIGPSVKTGVMAIIEDQPHGITADRLDLGDLYVVLTDLQGFLPRTVPADLGRRRIDPQILKRQLELQPVRVRDCQHSRAGAQGEGERVRGGHRNEVYRPQSVVHSQIVARAFRYASCYGLPTVDCGLKNVPRQILILHKLAKVSIDIFGIDGDVDAVAVGGLIGDGFEQSF